MIILYARSIYDMNKVWKDDGLSDGVGLDNDNDSSFDMSRDQAN